MVHPFRNWNEKHPDIESGIHPLRPDPDEVAEESGTNPFRGRIEELNEAENAGHIRPIIPLEEYEYETGIHPFRNWSEDYSGDE